MILSPSVQDRDGYFAVKNKPCPKDIYAWSRTCSFYFFCENAFIHAALNCIRFSILFFCFG